MERSKRSKIPPYFRASGRPILRPKGGFHGFMSPNGAAVKMQSGWIGFGTAPQCEWLPGFITLIAGFIPMPCLLSIANRGNSTCELNPYRHPFHALFNSDFTHPDRDANNDWLFPSPWVPIC